MIDEAHEWTVSPEEHARRIIARGGHCDRHGTDCKPYRCHFKFVGNRCEILHLMEYAKRILGNEHQGECESIW